MNKSVRKIKVARKNRVLIFLSITVLPLLLVSTTGSPLNQSIINTETMLIPAIGLTTSDITFSIGLSAAMLTIWVFVLKKRI